MSITQTNPQVVIHGGGMAGALLAKALSPRLRVVLVDPNEYFEIPMAAPRSVVDPDFGDSAIIPFAQALPGVEHVRGALTELRQDGGSVRLQDGQEQRLTGDIIVLATGSVFSNALVRAVGGTSVSERREFYRRYQHRIVEARRIVIVGGGPIGVELAGEIVERYPDKQLTILEAGPRLLSGTSEAAADYANAFLRKRGVTILADERFDNLGSSTDAFAAGGEARTNRGRSIAYDLLIWCIGGRPNTGYMQAHFASALNAAGRIRVTPELRVAGLETVFALGDITDLDENKMAWHINGHVKTAAHNIRALLADGKAAPKLKAYKPQTGNPKMAVTLGSRHGVVHLPGVGVVRWPAFVRMAKSGHMLVPQYRKALGV
ncbi:FAD-dependent oxidoreductase [Xanthomonas sp. CFBP 8703]|uniref:FAD-dependent oxidoreductase n=1 Tax=Xanthomonas bonasiae TaxID=2810351 RepID=A0ABS3B1X0_9XANT|nr:FAD-dependent oxidoreductase [Xanthomonas bonasiae]MBN6102318.1 FAD-dependent oxidoreductase [Xanthomonas bonasiae]